MAPHSCRGDADRRVRARGMGQGPGDRAADAPRDCRAGERAGSACHEVFWSWPTAPEAWAEGAEGQVDARGQSTRPPLPRGHRPGPALAAAGHPGRPKFPAASTAWSDRCASSRLRGQCVSRSHRDEVKWALSVLFPPTAPTSQMVCPSARSLDCILTDLEGCG